MMKLGLRAEGGGVALIMVLAFMALGVPVITSTLRLADTLAIDSRVKTDALKRDYCGLGVKEYVRYLTLDADRWNAWWQANQDPDLPEGEAAEETVTICGQSVILRVTRPPPTGDNLSEPPETVGLIPSLPAFNNRRLQSLKSVQPATASPGGQVSYTITVQNRASDPVSQVTKIRDELPMGFCYQPGSTGGQVTSGSTTTQVTIAEPAIDYLGGPTACPDPAVTQELEWDGPNVPVQTGDFVTLTFDAAASTADGTYCNEAWAEPGVLNTRSGKTAVVQVGSSDGVCDGPAVAITKVVSSITGLALAVPSDPLVQTFTFTVGYAITIENIGTEPLTVSRIRDLLPEGFTYNLGTASGDISFNPDEHWENQADRWRLTWDPSPELEVPSKLTDPAGATRTLSFDATATVPGGDYWSDTLVTLDDPEFVVPMYSWPTAVVTVRASYAVEATGPDGETTYISLQVLVGNESGTIGRWEIG